MDFAQPQLKALNVEVLTQKFQVVGSLTPLGDILSFLNDPQRETLIIEDAEATPIQAPWRGGAFTSAELVLPKSEVQIVLVDGLQRDDMQLLPRAENLVVYTDTFAVRGGFHTGSDTKVSDIFYITQGPFFPATNAEAYGVVSLKVAIGGAAPVLFLNKLHVAAFSHQQA